MSTMSLKIPPAVLLVLFSLVMWLVARTAPELSLTLSWSRPVSWLFYVLGVLIIAAGIVSFRLAQTTVDPTRPERASKLVTTGVFKYSRNPMYLGFLLFLVAWVVRLSHPLNLLLLPVFVWYLNRYQITAEEDTLRQLFKQDYNDYCARVRRWI